jgi:zinc D-Ala-D-Ala dipeptidase
VTEYLGGELLSEMLARRGALPREEALDVFLQVAAGLQAVHAAQWIHGNLSPETILLSPTGGGTLVKLIRFAQEPSKPARSEPHVEGKGSFEYASPERLAGGEPDERSDVYSLGAVFYHLLAGVPPRLASEGRPIPNPIRAVLARALAPFPDERYQTIAELVAAITSAAESEDAESEDQAATGSAAEPEYERATLSAAQSEAEPAIDRPVEPEIVAASEPATEPVILIPQGRRRSGRKVVRLALATAAVVILSAGVWLLLGRPRLTLHAFTWPRAEESAVVPRAEPESNSTSAAASVPPAPQPTMSGRGSAVSGAADSMLVDLRSVDSTIQVDLRYATANNFTGAPLPGYETQRALLRRQVASALGRVQAKLRTQGLGLRVFDAYRPTRASRAMVTWAESTGRRALLESGYIAERSRHNLGVAVDLTLVDLETGTELPMGTTFDNFTTDSQANVDDQALRNRQILAEAMTAEGFRPYGQAWWHFNYPLKGAGPLDQVIR